MTSWQENNSASEPPEILGDPFSDKPRYARNVWDITEYQQKIYFGYGNSSNKLPSPNAGPVYVTVYNPATQQFEPKTDAMKLEEQQLDCYKEINNKLYIPGHDPKGLMWDKGGYHILENGQITNHEIDWAIHMYDMLEDNGTLYGSLGTVMQKNSIVKSTDGGNSWQPALQEPGILNTHLKQYGRIYPLFKFGPSLYGCSSFKPVLYRKAPSDDLFIAQTPWSQEYLFPNTRLPQLCRILRPVDASGRLVYIGAETVNDHQWKPLGLYSATNDFASVNKITLPDKYKPYDIQFSNGKVWLLASKSKCNWFKRTYDNIIAVTSDLVNFENWEILTHMETKAYARSFAVTGGPTYQIYYGLGSDVCPYRKETGKIFRIKVVH